VKRKYLYVAASVVGAAAIVLGAAACNGQGSAQAKENAQQGADSSTLINNQPIPHFKYSEERAILIEAETDAASGEASTSFVFEMGVPNPIFSCPSLGLGVPDTAALSNPEQVVNAGGSGNPGVTIGQMDPFGVYTPSSSEGTYLVCVAGNGNPYLTRIESQVDTFLGSAVWDLQPYGHVAQVGTPPAAPSLTLGLHK
jgi:hypothetical protein